jgi:hypothetical protein
MAKVIQFEFKIGHVSKSISLPFERFDFGGDSIDNATKDVMEEVIQEPETVVHKGSSDFFEFLDAGVFGIGAPCIRERGSLFHGVLFPKLSELFLHSVESEQRSIGLEQLMKQDLFFLIEGFLVFQNQKPGAFENLFAFFLQLGLLVPAEILDAFVHEGGDVVVIKEDGHMKEVFFNSRDERDAHVHGDGLRFAGFSSQNLEKGGDVMTSFPFHSMQDATGFQVHKDAHIGLTLADTELVNRKILKLLQRKCFIPALQMLLVNVLDQIPTDPQDSGSPQHGHPMDQIALPLTKGSLDHLEAPHPLHSIRQIAKRRKVGRLPMGNSRGTLSLKSFLRTVSQLPHAGYFSMAEVTSAWKIVDPFSYSVLMYLTPLKPNV